MNSNSKIKIEKLKEFGFDILSQNVGKEKTEVVLTIKRPEHLIYPSRELDNIDNEIIKFYNCEPLGLLEFIPSPSIK